ncbi:MULTISPECIES: serine/threonine dehydratase [Kitasatospora]|uniref:Putative dehydratase n=1 Tax=Kitasatospora setae (strain ATCC 33774 / DSM 43861 / JCM 3304 / KCC A-0304 / NBRC 14216 / KM-6054) TaxID=452652 RepID=E4N6B8_KITSK|nr:serine/threonine dehydratase [Kitasatospora setae]BAJ26749.1 putative dehydratase [Kitasatospora setae KM-6054]
MNDPAFPAYDDVEAAARRIAGVVRRVPVVAGDADAFGGSEVYLVPEFIQNSGSFKDRGAANFIAAHLESGTVPEAGVVIASGGNAGLACAWAARLHAVRATVFVPETAPRVKVAKLLAYGAEVRRVGTEYAHAAAAAAAFADATGALPSHAYDDPHIAAGAGTLLLEILDQVPGLDSVVVAAGGGGLFTGTAITATTHGVRVVAVEPRTCRCLNAAIEADAVVDVAVDSVAADALGARRASEMALHWARASGADSLLVPDETIVAARRTLWQRYHFGVEHGGATAFAALLSGRYAPEPGERVAVVLCGANTDPTDLATDPPDPAGPAPAPAPA